MRPWMVALAVVIGVLVFCQDSSAQQPIIKKGSCPSGYRAEGNYCVPRGVGDNSPQVIEKKGKCPSGWRAEGKYCIRRGS